MYRRLSSLRMLRQRTNAKIRRLDSLRYILMHFPIKSPDCVESPFLRAVPQTVQSADAEPTY